MTKLVWSEAARDDLQRLYQFIAAVNSQAAAKMLRTILGDVKRLSEFPELGKVWDASTLERQLVVPFGASAYRVRYRYENSAVFVIRVWHGAEDEPLTGG